jgi:hypothetical protein
LVLAAGFFFAGALGLAVAVLVVFFVAVFAMGFSPHFGNVAAEIVRSSSASFKPGSSDPLEWSDGSSTRSNASTAKRHVVEKIDTYPALTHPWRGKSQAPSLAHPKP